MLLVLVVERKEHCGQDNNSYLRGRYICTICTASPVCDLNIASAHPLSVIKLLFVLLAAVEISVCSLTCKWKLSSPPATPAAGPCTYPFSLPTSIFLGGGNGTSGCGSPSNTPTCRGTPPSTSRSTTARGRASGTAWARRLCRCLARKRASSNKGRLTSACGAG